MIKILEPRYRDRKVLVACHKIPCGGDIEIQIAKGAYSGIYKAKNDDICASQVEYMKTRQGGKLKIRAIPIDKLVRIGE